jgi:hypothetical protein
MDICTPPPNFLVFLLFLGWSGAQVLLRKVIWSYIGAHGYLLFIHASLFNQLYMNHFTSFSIITRPKIGDDPDLDTTIHTYTLRYGQLDSTMIMEEKLQSVITVEIHRD